MRCVACNVASGDSTGSTACGTCGGALLTIDMLFTDARLVRGCVGPRFAQGAIQRNAGGMQKALSCASQCAKRGCCFIVV